MKDGALRSGVKGIARALFFAAVTLERIVLRLRGRAPFVLGGGCRSCGACCEAPSIRVGWLTWYLPTLHAAFVAWQGHVNGFVLVARDFRARALTFRCTHFDAATRRCDSYASRPGMCRDYPRLLVYQPHPELLAGCGHRPIARDARRMLRVIADQPMTDDQRARLKRDMFLE